MNEHKDPRLPSDRLAGPVWRTSSYSGNNGGQCVEVAMNPNGTPACLMRDSKNPGGPVLAFTPSQWRAFAARVKAGKFDLSS
jgi:hypothetical protein